MNYTIDININQMDAGTEQQMEGMAPTKKVKPTSKAGLGSYVAAQTIEPVINKVKDFIVSNVELNTGSRALQQKTDFAMQGVSLGVSVFKNAAGGFAIAGAAGAGVGLALSAVSYGLDIAFKSAQLGLERREEDYQRDYLQNRMGVAFNQSRR